MAKTPNGTKLIWLDAVALNYEGDDCLPFPFPVASHGYGSFYSEGREISAPRYICEIANGPPPTAAHEVAHSCNPPNRRCVNKRHLRWDTRAGNLADQLSHGTRLFGEKSPRAKLTASDVAKIRSAEGLQREIAAEFNITQRTVSDIKLRKSWAWL